MKRLITAAFAVILSLGALAQEVSSYDLVVYGGTSSGVIAACTAAREGLSVALIERTGHVGGLTTSGIGNVDIGWATTVGGYTAEFLRSVGAHYGTPHRMQISLECKIAEREFNRMLSALNNAKLAGVAEGTASLREAAAQLGRGLDAMARDAAALEAALAGPHEGIIAAMRALRARLAKEVAAKDRTFGNGRFARNLFERAIERQATRLADAVELSGEVLEQITKADMS